MAKRTPQSKRRARRLATWAKREEAKGKPPDAPASPHPATLATAAIAPQDLHGTNRLGKAERQVRVAEMYTLQHLSYRQIGDNLGVSAKTICLDIKEIMAALSEQVVENLKGHRQVETDRSYRVDRALINLLYHRDVYVRIKTARELRANAEFRAKLWGYYAPVKVAQTDVSGEKTYFEMTDEELDALIRERETELGILPTLDGEVIRDHTGRDQGDAGAAGLAHGGAGSGADAHHSVGQRVDSGLAQFNGSGKDSQRLLTNGNGSGPHVDPEREED